jgi:hypothetical protein
VVEALRACPPFGLRGHVLGRVEGDW